MITRAISTLRWEIKRLVRASNEAEKFYEISAPEESACEWEMEATGYARWFERLLANWVSRCDRRCGEDPGPARPQAENRPPGRSVNLKLSPQGAICRPSTNTGFWLTFQS
jgi:hypothetical protein